MVTRRTQRDRETFIVGFCAYCYTGRHDGYPRHEHLTKLKINHAYNMNAFWYPLIFKNTCSLYCENDHDGDGDHHHRYHNNYKHFFL